MMKERAWMLGLVTKPRLGTGTIKGMDLTLGKFQQLFFKQPFIVPTNRIYDTSILLKDLTIITKTTNHFGIIVEFSISRFTITTHFCYAPTGCHELKGKKTIVLVLVHPLRKLCTTVMTRQRILPLPHTLLHISKRIIQQQFRLLLPVQRRRRGRRGGRRFKLLLLVFVAVTQGGLFRRFNELVITKETHKYQNTAKNEQYAGRSQHAAGSGYNKMTKWGQIVRTSSPTRILCHLCDSHLTIEDLTSPRKCNSIL
mmetsp:Transcript_18194/g.31006  ORF Transcript_18194/g.31006 Transcript_18194/m.31006 type:complete len:255 (-) Transcript_18194:376-1140(-)